MYYEEEGEMTREKHGAAWCVNILSLQFTYFSCHHLYFVQKFKKMKSRFRGLYGGSLRRGSIGGSFGWGLLFTILFVISFLS